MNNNILHLLLSLLLSSSILMEATVNGLSSSILEESYSSSPEKAVVLEDKLDDYKPLPKAISSLSSESKQVNNNEIEWRIGGKIHFEEESGPDYIGTKEINQIVKDVLKKLTVFNVDLCSSNAKIMLKRDRNEIIMTHYEEKSRPGIGEEMHATLLYTRARGFCNSETLKQVCKNLFETCDFPPTVESVAKTYGSIIKPEWKFKISEVVVTKNIEGPSFITAKLLFDGHENININNKPISAGLHMTLVNLDDSSILTTSGIGDFLTKELNGYLKNKMVKIAKRKGVADLEFGMSGSSWRIRAGERVSLSSANIIKSE